jgi:hypothetical protein
VKDKESKLKRKKTNLTIKEKENNKLWEYGKKDEHCKITKKFTTVQHKKANVFYAIAYNHYSIRLILGLYTNQQSFIILKQIAYKLATLYAYIQIH